MINKTNSFLFSLNTIRQFLFCSGNAQGFFQSVNCFFQYSNHCFISGFTPNISVARVDAKVALKIKKSASVATRIQSKKVKVFPIVGRAREATREKNKPYIIIKIGAPKNSPVIKTIEIEMLFLPSILMNVLKSGENSAAPLAPVCSIKEAHPPQNPSMVLGNSWTRRNVTIKTPTKHKLLILSHLRYPLQI